MSNRISLADRFERDVSRTPGGCWRWMGYIAPHGYGRISFDRRSDYAHRVSYELHVGPIPDGLHIDHLCRNRWCVNPVHLDAVTSRVNVLRSPYTHGNEQTCPSGHPYSGDNLIIWQNHNGYPARRCRACQKTHMANHRAKVKAAKDSAA